MTPWKTGNLVGSGTWATEERQEPSKALAGEPHIHTSPPHSSLRLAGQRGHGGVGTRPWTPTPFLNSCLSSSSGFRRNWENSKGVGGGEKLLRAEASEPQQWLALSSWALHLAPAQGPLSFVFRTQWCPHSEGLINTLRGRSETTGQFSFSLLSWCAQRRAAGSNSHSPVSQLNLLLLFLWLGSFQQTSCLE